MTAPAVHRALVAARFGQLHRALEGLAAHLGDDPDDAEAHAWLSFVLLGLRRPTAAEQEARLALAADPTLPLGLYALGRVCLAQRRFDDADTHVAALLAVEPDDASNLQLLADLRRLQGRSADADAALARALELDPENVAVRVQIGAARLRAGDRDDAYRIAVDTLVMAPGHPDVLVLLGAVTLDRGEVDAARALAIEALRVRPDDEEAMGLLVACKARQSWWLGLWWRWQAWMNRGDKRRTIALLLGMYLAIQLSSQALTDLGQPGAAATLDLVWLAVAAYTWFAPALFRRMLDRELKPVQLRADF